MPRVSRACGCGPPCVIRRIQSICGRRMVPFLEDCDTDDTGIRRIAVPPVSVAVGHRTKTERSNRRAARAESFNGECLELREHVAALFERRRLAVHRIETVHAHEHFDGMTRIISQHDLVPCPVFTRRDPSPVQLAAVEPRAVSIAKAEAQQSAVCRLQAPTRPCLPAEECEHRVRAVGIVIVNACLSRRSRRGCAHEWRGLDPRLALLAQRGAEARSFQRGCECTPPGGIDALLRLRRASGEDEGEQQEGGAGGFHRRWVSTTPRQNGGKSAKSFSIASCSTLARAWRINSSPPHAIVMPERARLFSSVP